MRIERERVVAALAPERTNETYLREDQKPSWMEGR